jgi:hypothetical protein
VARIPALAAPNPASAEAGGSCLFVSVFLDWHFLILSIYFCQVHLKAFIVIALLLAISLGTTMAATNQIYFNDFNGPPGTAYSEWSSSAISYASRGTPPGSGAIPGPPVTNTVSPNRSQQFLGLFGGPRIGNPSNPGYNHTRVDQTIKLALTNLPPHTALTLAFDLYLIRSWDGNSPAYGPDRFRLSVEGGPVLLDTTFSNNPKTAADGSFQDYPIPNSAPWSGAAATNMLGYDDFFRDSTYRLQYSFPHAATNVAILFSSSLFEGKGITDEAWGLDNVRVSTTNGHE